MAQHWTKLVLVSAIFVATIAFFHVALSSNDVLFTTDSNYGSIVARSHSVPEGFTGSWMSRKVLGNAGVRQASMSSLLLWILPPAVYNDWIYGIYLAIASLFLCLFLRRRGLGWGACALAFLSAFWIGTNLTICYAGHIGKFSVLAFGMAALYLLDRALRSARWEWSVLAGGALGLMFCEQQDVALFLGMFLGAFAIYTAWRTVGLDIQKLAVVFVPMVITAAVVAGPVLASQYGRRVKGAASVERTIKSPEQKWDFCTQWSVPPDEMLDFVAPGYYGWRSHDPEGPYWGRTGRSAGYEDTGRGHRNFRLESIYTGAVPVVLALFALYFVLFLRRGHQREENGEDASCLPAEWRGDVIFWSVAAVLALLLSFGKYFPLYRLFWHLPVVSSIRNPNKFLHVFQLAVAILAAYGLDIALRSRKTAGSYRKPVAVFVTVFALLGLGLLTWAGILSAARGFYTGQFAENGWGNAAPVIVGNMIRASLHGGVLTVAGAALVAGLGLMKISGGNNVRRVLAWVAVAVIFADGLVLSQHYIKSVSKDDLVAENEVTRFLEENLGQSRVMLLVQSGFYNNWLTTLFPAHDIAFFNIAQARNIPPEHREFLQTVGRNPPHLWQLSSIKYLIGPAQIWKKMRSDKYYSQFTADLEPVWWFGVYRRGESGIGVEKQPAGMGQHVVLEYKKAVPRCVAAGKWTVVPEEQMCRIMAGDSFEPAKQALIAPSSAKDLPVRASSNGSPGETRIVKSDLKKLICDVSAGNPCIVYFSQQYDPDWKAIVDGEESPVLRCNYLGMGVHVPAGDHKVTFKYTPEARGLWIQAAGILLCLGAFCGLCVRRRRYA
ncbi:MAG: hypothetical protein R6V03_10600 [Kiritimatiellia bacterium]